jgi:methionyl-tRNA synthetase
VDALTNYITAVGYPDENSANFKKYWPADLHMVGKDILRFHAVYWPAFLMAAGIDVQKRVFAHGWWTNEGQKISKSLGNVIDPFELVKRYGLDQVRYFLLREVPFGNDGDFSHRAIVTRINSELANDLGNLAQRALSMINRNCDARLPAPGTFSDDDKRMLEAAHALLTPIRVQFENQAFHEALETIWRVVRAANGYVDRQAPWELRKSDPARMATVLYVMAETIRHIALIMQPFVPGAAGRILDQLGVAESARSFASFGPQGAGKPGTALPAPQGVFPRFVEAAEGAA